MSIDSGSFTATRLDLFWRFVCERQQVWWRRFVEGRPAPWTDDPILRRERFTNIYRELDPGTQYAIERILELDAPRSDKVFNVMMYRLVGRSDTHASMGFQYLEHFDPRNMERCLKKLRAEGKPPFTAAYMVSAYSSMGSSDKIENITKLFSVLHSNFDGFFARLENSGSAAEAHATLSSVYGFGNFLAYQILVDLLYPLQGYDNRPLLPFSHDEWASPGPGACRGIRMLLEPDTTQPLLEVMQWLRENQHSEFARLDLVFPYLKDEHAKEIPISLANIQNSLCEYHKYVKIGDGTGRGRRKFGAVLSQSAIAKRSVSILANPRETR